ncbi:uncharacterized protein BDZ99DRAFT_525790 [Mytilinidion resinicola]|uniref:Uncharacterized protein n=1 Tax=Mytilinidion resinicola TaxID=574789 RepID=A0A6A6Y6G4_9PEZI|nr:uncharacterized protein BDZ99DRAFT_525790 [Mytilinidion resinicola]KAF2804199.1 hypothetical protein BDZ99DRAFT_525790 [Mytilinidion resinicola]
MRMMVELPGRGKGLIAQKASLAEQESTLKTHEYALWLSHMLEERASLRKKVPSLFLRLDRYLHWPSITPKTFDAGQYRRTATPNPTPNPLAEFFDTTNL